MGLYLKLDKISTRSRYYSLNKLKVFTHSAVDYISQWNISYFQKYAFLLVIHVLHIVTIYIQYIYTLYIYIYTVHIHIYICLQMCSCYIFKIPFDLKHNFHLFNPKYHIKNNFVKYLIFDYAGRHVLCLRDTYWITLVLQIFSHSGIKLQRPLLVW